jgi:transposase
METLAGHYHRALGLDDSWRVSLVDLDMSLNRVLIQVEHVGGSVICPECQRSCSIFDHAPERRWRHLDMMQFETVLVARVPRANCPQCGAKTIAAMWAGKGSRFTLAFEAFAIAVLKACRTVSAASQLLKLDRRAVNAIMTRAVERGLKRRRIDQVTQVGIDEKSFASGHSYVTILTDVVGKRVLDVVPDRTSQSAEKVWQTLPKEQREQIRAVAVDLLPAYVNSVKEQAPHADVVHDKFHLVKYLNEAVDQVRRAEHKSLKKVGDERLKGSRQLWLFHHQNLSRKQQRDFAAIKREGLKTARAYGLKEMFRHFWNYTYRTSAEAFFTRWYQWASRSRLKPIIKVAHMFKRHLPNILNYFWHRITNATSEGFNSIIQSLKAAARGFHHFESYRTRILFYCGKLDLTT